MATSQNGCAVLVERVNDHIEIRNAALGDDSRILSASVDDWGDFLINIQDGILPAGVLRTSPDGADVMLLWHTDSDQHHLEFPSTEWEKFVELVRREEYDIEKLSRRTSDTPA